MQHSFNFYFDKTQFIMAMKNNLTYKYFWFALFFSTEVLSSDEDEIDEQGQEYLEALSRRAIATGAATGFPINATINDISADTDDSDSDYEANEETALEAYGTPLDEEDCDIDEYMVFKEVMTSMYHSVFLLVNCNK